MGTAQTSSGDTPLIVHASQEEDRERVLRETSGGVLFTDAADMPSLERLLEEYQVSYAVLEVSVPDADGHAVVSANRDWREDAQDNLRLQAAIADRDGPMDEDYVFMATLGDESLDAFLARANALLEDPLTSKSRWRSFLEAEAVTAGARLAHEPLALATEESPAEALEAPLLLTLEDLDLTFSGGALGGPRPLADSAEQ